MTLQQLAELCSEARANLDLVSEIELAEEDYDELISEAKGTIYYKEGRPVIGGVVVKLSNYRTSYITKMEDMFGGDEKEVTIRIEERFLKKQTNSWTHKCRCDSWDLLWYGCRCGGK